MIKPKIRNIPADKLVIISIISLVVIAGVATALFTKAATGSIISDPELGKVSGDATVVSDAAAANGKTVRFGSATITPPPTPSPNLTQADYNDLKRWAATTYASLDAMTDPTTGLVADKIDASLASSSRSINTSPTNIGLDMWSTMVAAKLGIITDAEAQSRVSLTLDTLGKLERHKESGMFYNWYDIRNGSVLKKWPGSNDTVYPFASSVDNAWMAAGLKIVANGMPSQRSKALALYNSMDFKAFYNADRFGGSRPGLFRGGFWVVQPGSQAATVGTLGGSQVWFTPNDYDLVNTETRIISYVAIPKGDVPPAQYFSLKRTFSPGKGYSWTEQSPTGVNKLYAGTSVFEGTFAYRGMQIMPTWGGSMFEELMPDLVIPEKAWGTKSWAINHPLAVQAHIQHGLDEAKYGYWGFSPASNPFGGYKEYGVDEVGISPEGYYSDKEGTNVDKGYGTFRPGKNLSPTFGNGVITPHASFLALPYAPREAIDNLRKVEKTLGAYAAGGFYDAVAVKTNTKAAVHLSLDQGMIMGALGNFLADDMLHKLYASGEVETTIKPLLNQEEFGSASAAQ